MPLSVMRVGVQASCIIFTAMCSVLFLHRKLNSLHVRGIIAAVAGVGVVSYAGFIYARNQAVPPRMLPVLASSDGQGSKVEVHVNLLVGVLLTLASQFAQVLRSLKTTLLRQYSIKAGISAVTAVAQASNS